MKFSIEKRDLTTVRTDLLVVNMHDGRIEDHTFAHHIDKKLKGELKKVLSREKFEGKPGQAKLLNTHGKIPANYVLVIGLGDKKSFNLELVRKAGGKIAQVASQIRAAHVTTAAHGGHLGVFSKQDCTQAVVEGISLASYKFTRYKKEPKDSFKLNEVALLCPDKTKIQEVTKGINLGQWLSRGVCLARDLVNAPANDMTPVALGKVAASLKGIKTRVYNAAWIKKMKMGAFYGVAQGSTNPPVFIEMHYKPSGKAKKKVALVGKGVTFDSGGLSLKPPKSMETMKDDMSGAAGVIGLMSVIAELKPKVEVWGFVAATENMPDGTAQRPGDIVTAMNGKTIEVLNTDAEGRLTLADACHYANSKKPDYMIDAATLTGACLVALGDKISAIFGNDRELIERLMKSSQKTGEKLWELPLAEDYKDELKSPIADLKNIGGSYGGAINGGLFIQEFVGKTKWVHLDIAGPAYTERPKEYESRGGTGVMVRTFADFIMNL